MSSVRSVQDLSPGGIALANEESSGLNYIREKVNKFLEYSIDNISYIRQDELDKFPETQNELSRVRQELEDLEAVTDQARKEYEKFRAGLLDTSLNANKEIGNDDYSRGAHLLKMLSTFEERQKDMKEQERILSLEVDRIQKLMSASTEMANKFRLAMRVMGSEMEDLNTGAGSDVKSLINAYKIAERESISLARDLHDGPAQKLASAVLLVELVERMVRSGDTEKALEELGQITGMIRESLWDTRSFLLRLNPKGLEYGLDLAIKRFIDQIRIISDTEVSLTSKGDFSLLSLPQRSNVFKIIHQAVMNAVQKGKAQKVQIFLNGGRKTLKARVIDDGAGFDVEAAIRQAKERGSFGLMNMEERTRIAGGTIQIDSSPGRGTHISIEIPVSEADQL